MKGVRPLFLLCLLSLVIIQPVALLSFDLNPIPPSFPIPVTKSELSSNISVTPKSQYSREPSATESAPRNWTVLVYMSADNAFEDIAVEDIKEMEQVGSTHWVNIIVFVDFLSNLTGIGPEAYSFNVTHDTPPINDTIWSSPLSTALPAEPNMGDPATLLSFIQFGQNYSKATNYLLILWDYGAGYEGVCYDETSGGDRLLPYEIAMVLENDTIDPITVTAFDASLMGQLEVAYEIQDGTELIIVSEETLPQFHFPYQKFLLSLTLFPNSSPIALAKEIVDRYIEAYSVGGIYYQQYLIPPTRVGLSVINSTSVNSIFSWFNRTINMLNTPLNLPFYYSAICEVRGRVQQFSVPNIIDLGSFANQMWLTIPTRALQNLVGNLSLSIQSAIVYERHLSGIPGTTGLAVNFDLYQPTSLSFLNNSQYEQFLANFHLIGETIETAIVPLQAGPLIGYLDGENDSVYYRYDPQIAAQHTLHLTAFQPIGEDFDLYLFDSNMNFLTRSVETGSTETIQYAFVPGQIYYIRAFSHPVPDSDFGFGAFQIAITYSPPINPASIALIIGIIAAIAVMIFVISYIVYHNRSKIATALRQLRTNDQRQIESPPQGDLESQTSTECIQCGESLPENAKFCPNCGKIFEEPSEESGKVED